MPRRIKTGRTATVILPIVNSPELSACVGYLASEQRRAYNHAIAWLNREPRLALMKSGGEKTPRHRSLQGRISDLRDPGSATYEPSWTCAPRWVHNAGASLAHRANARFMDDRRKRLWEIRRIEDRRHRWAERPPRSDREWERLRREERRYARLTRAHRRTVAFRSRKRGSQTLEVDNNTAFRVTPDRMSIWIGTLRTGGFRIPLRRPLPADTEVCSFRLVELRRNRQGVKNRRLADVSYEAHVALRYPEATPRVSPESPDEVVGVDVGVMRAWATSDGQVFTHDGPRGCQCPRSPRRRGGRRGRFQHRRHCVYGRPRVLQGKAIAKPGGSRRSLRMLSKRRQKLERRRREILRIRSADRDRAFTAHAQALLDRTDPPVRMVAVEGLRRRDMMTSARGGVSASGEGVRRKAGLNRALAEVASGSTVAILHREAAKRGIPVVAVDPSYSSRTCARCGHESRENRKSQAVFECVACGWAANADHNAARVIADRAYRQQVDPAALQGAPHHGRVDNPSRQDGGPGPPPVKAHNATPVAAARGESQGAQQRGGGRGTPRRPRR